jgi:hypothetical protein
MQIEVRWADGTSSRLEVPDADANAPTLIVRRFRTAEQSVVLRNGDRYVEDSSLVWNGMTVRLRKPLVNDDEPKHQAGGDPLQ